MPTLGLVFPITATELLERLCRTRRSLHPLDRLSRLFGVRANREGAGWADRRPDPESVTDAAAALEQQGMVEVWDHPERGPVVVLSALAAERFGLELSGDGRTWRKVGTATRPTKVKRRDVLRREVERSQALDFVDFAGMTVVPAPRPGKTSAPDEGCGPRRLALWLSCPHVGCRCWANPERILLIHGCRDIGLRYFPAQGA